MFFNVKHEITGYRRRKSGRVLPDYTPIINIYDRGLIYRIYKNCDGHWEADCHIGGGERCIVGCVSQRESRFRTVIKNAEGEQVEYKSLTLAEVIRLVQTKVESGRYEDLRRFLRNYDAIAESSQD